MTTGKTTGTIRWFDRTKGYGFITPDGTDGKEDVFVHISDVENSNIGVGNFAQGAKVSYDVELDRRGRKSAKNLRLL